MKVSWLDSLAGFSADTYFEFVDFCQQLQDRLNQIGMASAGNPHQPPRGDTPAAPSGGNPPAQLPARRPTFRRSCNNSDQSAGMENDSHQSLVQSSLPPVSNYQPPPIHLGKTNNSTPIFRRPVANQKQPSNYLEII